MKEIIIGIDDLNNFVKVIRKYKNNDNIKLLFKYENKLYEKPDDNLDRYNRYLEVIEVFNIKDKRKRLSYIYDNVCAYFDRDMREKNYCEFENGTCIANRLGKSVHSDNGCCYRKRQLCKFLTNEGCINPNPTCKIFMCSYLNKVKKVPNYSTKKLLITSCLLNSKGHDFFKRNYFITKDEFIDKFMSKIKTP